MNTKRSDMLVNTQVKGLLHVHFTHCSQLVAELVPKGVRAPKKKPPAEADGLEKKSKEDFGFCCLQTLCPVMF
jgi:hypothetical protein